MLSCDFGDDSSYSEAKKLCVSQGNKVVFSGYIQMSSCDAARFSRAVGNSDLKGLMLLIDHMFKYVVDLPQHILAIEDADDIIPCAFNFCYRNVFRYIG